MINGEVQDRQVNRIIPVLKLLAGERSEGSAATSHDASISGAIAIIIGTGTSVT
ncbi:MAG: hypothetical protein P8Z78_07440 [Gammaproteobacteria bacterium]